MIGVVDVGGGFRGIYGAGVFDRFMDEKIKFDYCIGVSAGSANVISYMGGQRGRNYKFYSEYASRKEYLSIHNAFVKDSCLDLNYVYGTLSNSDGENPLDYKAVMDNEGEMIVVTTDALTGKPEYFTKDDIAQDDYSIIKASSSIPVVCKPDVINGVPYYDGGVSDPVPIKKAFADGCDKVVLILTKPMQELKKPLVETVAAKMLKNKYPEVSKEIDIRYELYNDSIKLAQEYEKQGKCCIISPEDCFGVAMLHRNKDSLDKLYKSGYEDAKAVKSFLDNTDK